MMHQLLQIIDFLDKITIIFATITMLGVIYNFRTNYRNRQAVEIAFFIDGVRHPLKHAAIIRRHFSRSEVLGLLGIFQKDSTKRYNIAYLSTQHFFDELLHIQQGKKRELLIHITPAEFEQFDLSSLEASEAL